MIVKRDMARLLVKDAEKFPAITLTGPRQSGKTTLCRAIFPEHPYVNLEAPDVRQFALEDPRGFLAELPDGAILDEIQRTPDIPSYLQSVIDSQPVPGRWILTGSQNLTLSETVSQSLAGRTSIRQLYPFTYSELQHFEGCPESIIETLFMGSFPGIFYLGMDPTDWYRSYIATYIERDVRMMKNIGDLTTFQRFVELCATRTAQLLNYASLAGDCGISQPSAKSWISLLEATNLVFRLTPFHANLRKRIVKMPKLHFIDTGLLCFLLGIRSVEHLQTHPLAGSIFESWVVSEFMKHRCNSGETRGLSFYRDSNGAEVDLIVNELNVIKLIDAKLSRTASSSLFAGIRRVARHFDSFDSVENIAVYGGEQPQNRSIGTILPWNQINSLMQ